MNDQNFKNLCLKVFYSEILWNPQTFLFLFNTLQRKDAHRKKPQLKVEIEDGCKAP